MAKGGKATRRRLNNGEARERIIEVAETLFATRGYDSVSFRDLTQEAGVSLSAIHYHFGSKAGVLSEIFARRAKSPDQEAHGSPRGRAPLPGRAAGA